MSTSTTLTPHQQKILQIAERYNAYPNSGAMHIRGIEDVLEFADEVQGLALEQVETVGTRARPEPPFVKWADPPQWKAGDLCRYGSGSTALVKLLSPHLPAHGWHGTQCMGRTVFISTEDLIPASRDDRLTWVDCAMRWRKKSKAKAYAEAGLPVPTLDEFDVTSNPLKIHEVFEHDQQCDDMAGVPSASAEEPIAVTPMRDVANELIASVAECFGVAQASQLLRDVACVNFRQEIPHRHLDAVALACEALHKVGHPATGGKVWHFFPNGELRHIALANT